MNNGSNRRSRRRYKLRYDRIIAVVLVFIVLIVIITSCAKSCGKDDNGKNNNSQSSVVDELTSGAPQAATGADGQTGTNGSDDISVQPSDSAATEYTTETIDYAQVSKGDLVLVNSLHPYSFAEGDVNIATLFDHKNNYYSAKDNLVSLDENVISQLNALMEAYAAATANTDLQIINSYRTLEEQNDKYNSGKSNVPGGYSDYHTARTFDIGIFPKDGDSYYYSPNYSENVNYGWFDENAANYGFVVRYPEGKDTVTGETASTYTYRYVGIPHAVYMKQNNLCLEEYIDQIKSYNNTNTLKVTNGASQYEIYYVAANINGTTDVPVPSNKAYTISGNNADGFIITVTVA